MAAAVQNARLACEELVRDALLQTVHPNLHHLIKRTSGISGLYKDMVDVLRRPIIGGDADAGLPCKAEEIAMLGERFVELEELEDIIRRQWPNAEDRYAAYYKFLRCGIESPQTLLSTLSRKVSGRSVLNDLLEKAGFKTLRDETLTDLLRSLDARVRRIDLTEEGTRPVLVTAPHNIYLQRDGHPAHVMEEYTTLIAQRLARQLGGCCVSWSRAEQHRSELLWFLAKRRTTGDDWGSGVLLDPRNRDPNYLLIEEVLENPWYRHMLEAAEQFRRSSRRGQGLLHVDVHGCRDPPHTPSHLTVGLAAMRHEVEMGRGPLTLDRVEAFGALLESEFRSVLAELDLRPPSQLVRVLIPTLSAGSGRVERLSGARPLEEGRVTQSQQAVAYAGFTHSCQLELSKALRGALSRDEQATTRFGRAILKAWLVSLQPSLPAIRTKEPVSSRGGNRSWVEGSSRKFAAVVAPLSHPPRSRGAQSCPAASRRCQRPVGLSVRASRPAP